MSNGLPSHRGNASAYPAFSPIATLPVKPSFASKDDGARRRESADVYTVPIVKPQGDPLSVLMVGVLPLWSEHLVWQFELMERHLKRGDHVQVEVCFGDKPACDANLNMSDQECARCAFQHMRAIKQGSGRVRVLPACELAGDELQQVRAFACKASNWDELWNLRYEDFDLGVAVLSSLLTTLANANIDFALQRDRIEALARTGLNIYLSAKRGLQRTRPDYVYVFNGRLVHTRAWLRACQAVGVPFCTYDHGPDLECIRFYQGSTPHSISTFERMAMEHWSKHAGSVEREAQAERFFLKRRGKQDAIAGAFIARQETGRLPTWWNSKQRWITVYTSSEDEFRAVGAEWKGGIYPDQYEGVKALAVDKRLERAGIHIAIRLHPRMASYGDEQWRPYLALANGRVRIIPPNDSCDSYALLEASEKVLSFASTMGVEAAFWGRPVILLGPTFYMRFGVCYVPATHNEVVTLILVPDLPCKPREGALVYGFFQQTNGERLRHASFLRGGPSMINGVPLNLPKAWKLVTSLNHCWPFTRLLRTRLKPGLRKLLISVIPRQALRVARYTARR